MADPRPSEAQAQAIQHAIAQVIRSGRYILGDEVESFEREFAAYIGANHAVGVATGTDALIIGLLALDIGAGDAVITVSHTSVATVAAIHRVGATPVLADVRRDNGLMDSESVRALLRSIADGQGPVPAGSVRALLTVHLYGDNSDLLALQSLADEYGLELIEDCAQSTGSVYHGRRSGSFGRFSAFSFYPTKNLGALGDGGMLVTSDSNLYSTAQRLRQYGWSAPQLSLQPGLNSRLDEIQAAALRCKLPDLETDNQRRRAVARTYLLALSQSGLRLPRDATDEHVFHQFAIRSVQPDALAQHLAQRGIGTGRHYAIPVHLQPGYAALVRRPIAGLPETEAWANETLSLPVHPRLNSSDVERVLTALSEWHEPVL